MTFAPENPLEEVMTRAVSEPLARPLFYRLLMQSPLVALGRVEEHTAGDEVLHDLDSRYFELTQIKVRGRSYHPLFTAMSRKQAVAAQESHFTVSGHTLLRNTRGASFLINYGSDVGKELLPQEIDMLLGQMPAPAKKQNDEIVITLPDPYPGRLTGALGIFFLNRSQVTSAHLVQAAFPGRGEKPHLLIGLVMQGDPQRIVKEIGEVAAAVQVQHVVDVTVLNNDTTRNDLQTRLLSVPPFYARPITPQS